MAGLSPALMSMVSVRKPVGLYVGDREVTFARIALAPLGPFVLETRSEPYEPDQLAEVIGRMLKPLAIGRRPIRERVAVGLSHKRVFFSTRPVQSAEQDASPAVLLHEVLRSSDVNVDEMQVDLVKTQPGKRPLVSLIACRRKYVSDVLDALGVAGVRPFRAEPGPLALLRYGAQLCPGPRKAANVLRVFLGATQGVVLLIRSGHPMAWRTFELPPGGERIAVLSTSLAIQVVSRHLGETDPPDGVIVHGRTDLADEFKSDEFTAAVGAKVTHAPEPHFDDRSIAVGLALGCREGEQSFDLARTLKTRPPVWEVIPWGTIATQAAVLAGLTFLLDYQCGELRQTLAMLDADVAGHAWVVKVSDASLNKERGELTGKVAAVRSFVESRVVWTTYLHDVATRLSDEMAIKTFNGLSPFVAGAKTPTKSLVLGVTTTYPPYQLIPTKIDEYLDKLRADKTLRREFPVVELNGLKLNPAADGEAVSQASFVVNCLWKTGASPGPAPPSFETPPKAPAKPPAAPHKPPTPPAAGKPAGTSPTKPPAA